MKRVLITGGSSSLAVLTARKMEEAGYQPIIISSSASSPALRCNFKTADGVIKLDRILNEYNPSFIIHCASLYKGLYSSSTADDLMAWSIFLGAAHIVAKHCIDNKGRSRAILIGSIAGVEGQFYDSLPLYGQYKASLRSIAEGAHLEGGDIRYVNLGSFNESGDGITALNINEVVKSLTSLCTEDEDTSDQGIMVNLIPKNELTRQCSGRLWRR